MLPWLSQHIGTILICAVLIAVFALLIRSLIRDRKAGKSSCCGGCQGCAMAGQCHPQATASSTPTATEDEEPASGGKVSK